MKIKKKGQSPLSGLNKTVNVAEIIKEETLSEPVVEEPVVYQKEPVSRTVTPTKSKKMRFMTHMEGIKGKIHCNYGSHC